MQLRLCTFLHVCTRATVPMIDRKGRDRKGRRTADHARSAARPHDLSRCDGQELQASFGKQARSLGNGICRAASRVGPSPIGHILGWVRIAFDLIASLKARFPCCKHSAGAWKRKAPPLGMSARTFACTPQRSWYFSTAPPLILKDIFLSTG